MNRFRLLMVVLMASLLAGVVVEHGAAQGQAAAVYIYPRRDSTDARLKIVEAGSCAGSQWYYVIRHRNRFAPGNWSAWSYYATVYIEPAMDLVCANKYTVVDLLESGETVQFEVTEYEDSCKAPVYDCDEDAQMTVSYNSASNPQLTSELGAGQSESTWWYYDDH